MFYGRKYDGRAYPPALFTGSQPPAFGAAEATGFEIEVPGTVRGLWISAISFNVRLVFYIDDVSLMPNNRTLVTPQRSDINGALRSVLRYGSATGGPPNPRFLTQAAGNVLFPTPVFVPGGQWFAGFNAAALNQGFDFGVYAWEEDLV